MFFLTYIQGELMGEWVKVQHRWLNEQIDVHCMPTTSKWLWTMLYWVFQSNFVDVLEQEVVQAMLHKGIKMEGDKLDDYIAKFEQAVRHAGYSFDTPQTLNSFVKGLPHKLYIKVYEHNNPQSYNRWKECAMDRQCQWFHIHSILDNPPHVNQGTTKNNWGPWFPPGLPRFIQCHPDAVDTSTGHIKVQVAEVGDPNWEFQQPSNPWQWRNRDGGNPVNLREVTCYNCHNKGHFSRNCPQPWWNQNRGGSQGNWGGGGNYRGHGGGWNNACRVEVKDDTPKQESLTVARVVSDNHSVEEWVQYWLDGVAQECDEVKDKILQTMWSQEDFPDTLTQQSGWGLLIVTLYT